MKKKVIIFSAPSGSGKSTIVNYLLAKDLGLEFSVSATCRAPRGEEKHGKEYYFFSTDEFKERIEAGDFLEWEEVYPGFWTQRTRKETEISSWNTCTCKAEDLSTWTLALKNMFRQVPTR